MLKILDTKPLPSQREHILISKRSLLL